MGDGEDGGLPADHMWDASLRDHLKLRTRKRIAEQGLNFVTSAALGFFVWDSSREAGENLSRALVPTAVVFFGLGLSLLAYDVLTAMSSQRRALVAHIKAIEIPEPTPEPSPAPSADPEPPPEAAVNFYFHFSDGTLANRTSTQLWALLEGATSAQVPQRVARFVGSEVHLDGVVADIEPIPEAEFHTTGFIITLQCDRGTVNVWVEDETFFDAVQQLAPGDEISAEGKVSFIDTRYIIVVDASLASI